MSCCAHSCAFDCITIPDRAITLSRRRTITLLSDNAKLKKAKANYVIRGLSLAPARYSGHLNVCPSAGKCAKDCVLWFAGRTVTQNVRKAAIDRTELLANDRPLFMEKLHAELTAFEKYAVRNGERPLCRLNVASDLDWRDVVTAHPSITFYDYTKVFSRACDAAGADWPKNYEITYSFNERSNWALVERELLLQGRNVSVVFNTPRCGLHTKADPLPETWNDWPVVDADQHDVRLRAFDGVGVLCGLRFKRAGCSCGKVARPNGFIQDATRNL